MTPGAEEQAPPTSERPTEPALRPAGPGPLQAVWKYLESTPAPWRVVGIAAHFDESLGRLLGERGEAFQVTDRGRPVAIVTVWGPEHRVQRRRLPEIGRDAVRAAGEITTLLSGTSGGLD